MSIKNAYLLFFILAVLSCRRAHIPTEPNQFDRNIIQSPKMMKIGDSLEIHITLPAGIYREYPRQWEANIGKFSGTGDTIKYYAPLDTGIARINVKLISQNEIICDSISIIIYKQIIILKADDFTGVSSGTVTENWTRFINLILKKKIKAGLGLIGNSIDGNNKQYFELIKKLYLTNRFEFWNHGFDHVIGAVNSDGEIFHEFMNTSLEHQKEHLFRTQELAKEKLGIVLRTFGAPGNAFDENTRDALDSVDDIKVWLFGSNESDKLVLGRFAEIEFPTHYPDYNRFIDNYDSTKNYLALQIHPNSWDGVRLDEFEKIVDFLVQEKATFLTPYEYFQYSQ
jgi:peptidoglycan/xylan/chitin deacetylase (PgdA/CDA1 family)